MHIVVIGLGEVGRHLVRVLEKEGHDVVAIDWSKDAVRYVEEHHDVMILQGYGAGERVLTEARAEKADLLVAVTDHDEVNLVAAIFGRQMGAKHTIARCQSNEWVQNRAGVRYELLGVDVVLNPSILVAHELVKVARSHGAVEVIDLSQDRIELVQVEMGEDSRLIQKTIASLPLPRDTLIAAIVREGSLFVPGGEDILLPDDHVYLVGRPEDLPQAESLFTTKRHTRRTCLVGGGVTGESIARELADDGHDVLIIESSLDRAEELSASLRKVTVLHGDGTDTRLLVEEEIGTYDLFAAVTSDDELNLMAALLAQRMGVSRTAAMVHRPDYVPIYKKLGIDIVVSPRTVASDHILRYSRTAELSSLTVLQNGQAEVLEIVARRKCRATGIPLRELKAPRGALFAAIVHDNKVTIPRGEDVIEVGDTAIVLTTAEARPRIERLFRPGIL